MTRRTRATFILAATAALLALAPASPASAQGDAPAGDVTKDATTMLYNAGIDAAKSEQWEKAYESFQAAWKIKQHPQIAVNLGRAALKTGRPLEAAERLTFFLRETKDQVQNQDRAAVQKLLLEAKQKIGTLLVKVNKPGAEVVVDGQVVGQAPLGREVFVDAGSHTVEARLGKERAEPVTVDLKAGDSRQVGLTFGGGKSTVEGEEGEKPVEKPKQDGGSVRIFGDPDPKWLIAGGAAAGVGLASGIVFLSLASGVEKNDALNRCFDEGAVTDPACDDERDARNRATMFTNIGIWSFVGAGVAGAATLVYAIAAPRKAEATGTRVVPVATATGGGITVLGRW